jgi:hypothetical protein
MFTNNEAINVRDGYPVPRSGYGGAIYSLAAAVNIKGCTFTNNAAAQGGGAVYIDPSTLTVDSSTILGNSAPQGADIYNLDSSVTITQSQVGDVANYGDLTVIASTVGSLTGTGTVLDPIAEIDNLIAQVAALSLNSGEQNALTVKLQAAQQSLANGNTTAAANQLNAFINQANALVRSQRLGELTGDALIDDVQGLVDAIS